MAGFDRDAARADQAWSRWHAALRKAPVDVKGQEPLAAWRHVAGRNAYEAVRELAPMAADVAWQEALLRWILELTQRRTSCELLTSWALAAEEAVAHLNIDRPRVISYRQAWRELVAERERAKVVALLDAAAERGPELAALAHAQSQRRVEVARRTGLTHPLSLATSMTHSALRAAALDVLRRTDDLAGSLRREARRREANDAHDATLGLMAAIVADAPEGWPSSLTKRWLEDLFGDLARGLTLDVSLPPALGAASFARALGAFGYSLRVAGVSRSLPFALAQDPYPVDAHRFALVFAALVASPTFQRRALHNVARVAQGQARRLAAGALFEARAIAVRALLTDDMEQATPDVFEELSGSLFGGPLPARLRGAWPRARGDEWVRLLALLTAGPLAQELVERFDVDWFANPRAATYLRARASAPARDLTDLEPVPTTGVGQLGARFEEALG